MIVDGFKLRLADDGELWYTRFNVSGTVRRGTCRVRNKRA